MVNILKIGIRNAFKFSVCPSKMASSSFFRVFSIQPWNRSCQLRSLFHAPSSKRWLNALKICIICLIEFIQQRLYVWRCATAASRASSVCTQLLLTAELLIVSAHTSMQLVSWVEPYRFFTSRVWTRDFSDEQNKWTILGYVRFAAGTSMNLQLGCAFYLF